MTVTRLWQAGAEWRQAGMEFNSVSDALFTHSSTQKKTGGWAFRTELYHYAAIALGATYSQVRVGLWAKTAGVASGDTPRLITLQDGLSETCILRWDGTNFSLYDTQGGALLGSVASAAFAAGDWVHVGLDVKISNTGWAYLYLNGVAAISFAGDTNVGGSGASEVRFGGVQVAHEWSQYLYLDDLYIENLAGESAPAAVPTYRFDFVYPNGAGDHGGTWTGSDGNSTDNHLLVDEQPHDSDTTYIQSDTPGAIESAAMTDITLDAGWQPNAVIPMAVAKKTETASTLQAKLYTQATVLGTDYFASGAAISLSTAYALLWQRRIYVPDSVEPWTEAAVDSLEIGIEVV